MSQIQMLLKTVAIKNRIVDKAVSLQFDGETVTWAPGETKHLPVEYANWFRAKSCYLMDTVNNRMFYSLTILDGDRQTEDDLLAEEMPSEEDGKIDWSQKQFINPTTGKAYRRVAINTSSMPIQDRPHPMQAQEDRMKAEQHAALVDAGTERIAGMASQMSEAEVAAGVKAAFNIPTGGE